MRRRLLLAAPALLAGCSILPSRPYLERRDWPLAAKPPAEIPPPSHAPALLLRTLQAAAGTQIRGLQVLQPDGSIHTDYYEQWSVPPPDAVEDALRRWLAASGRFAAVLAPGTRALADYALEAELLAILAEPGQGRFHIEINLVLIDLHPAPARVLRQADLVGTAPLRSTHPEAIADAGNAALADLMEKVTALLRLPA